MPTLLYYPLVSPPKEVIHQALLYWDDLSSVVPEDPDVFDHVASTDLKDLYERGLYAPIRISSLLRGVGAIRDASLNDVLLMEVRNLATSPRGPLESRIPAFLLQSKFGQAVEEEIVALGLGRRLERREQWGRRALSVSSDVRLLLVGAVAHTAAAHSPHRAYTPYTDEASADDIVHRVAHPEWNLSFNSIGAWRVELGRLLPTPAPGTPTSEVIAFRAKYADERERLVGATQRMLSGLQRQWDHPADVLHRMRVELKEAREDYQSAARSSRLAWVARSVSVTVAVTTATTAALVLTDLEWVAAMAGSIGFNIATREIRPLRHAAKGHPFSYLHQVERELA